MHENNLEYLQALKKKKYLVLEVLQVYEKSRKLYKLPIE